MPRRSIPSATLVSFRNILAGDTAFHLKTIEEFPYSTWTEKQEEYSKLCDWYDGTALDADIQEQSEGDAIDLYPVKINPIRGACLKHSYALFGEFPEGLSGPPIRFAPLSGEDGVTESDAHMAESIVNRMWWENYGGAQMMENGLLSQIYGGCIFALSYRPDDKSRSVPIRVDRILPTEFVGIPSDYNPWILKEAWIVRRITPKTALEYGVQLAADGYWIEEWTTKKHSVRINTEYLAIDILNGKGEYVYNEANPYNVVPVTYIPHIRSGRFWGESLITPAAQGLVKEMNLRLGDIGDAVNDESHGILVMRNVRGTPRMIRITDDLEVLNIGSTQNLSTQEQQPDMFNVRKSSVSSTMVDLNNELNRHFRREVSVPAIADGEDEGSQRSSLTLNIRLWPLISHTRLERMNWTTGLSIINSVALKMLETKNKLGVTESVARVPMKARWYPSLPRDREQVVAEAVQRIVNGLGSPEQLIQLFGDVEDPEVEIDRIVAWLETDAKIKAMAKAQSPTREDGDDGSEGNGGGSGETRDT